MFYQDGKLGYDDCDMFRATAAAWKVMKEKWEALIAGESDDAPGRDSMPNGEGKEEKPEIKVTAEEEWEEAERPIVPDHSLVSLLGDEDVIPGVQDVINCTVCQRDGAELSQCSAEMEFCGWPYGGETMRYAIRHFY